jgi:hypothetical protein
MKVLLMLSRSEVHRTSNVELYKALKKQLGEVTWVSNAAFELYRTLPKGYMYLETVDETDPGQFQSGTQFSPADFDVAIIDQSVDPTEEDSDIAYAVRGVPNRCLDNFGRHRPSEVVRELTAAGIVCIGTSRNGTCCSELAEAGAVLTCRLEELTRSLPVLMAEAQRLVEDNSNDSPELKALTLRQPWAWTVFHTGKDMENRTWPAKIRGTVAIHAAEEQPSGVYENSKKFIRGILAKLGIKGVRIPSYDRLDKGAIIGLVDIVDCVSESDSPWFEGPIGYKLANPRLLPRAIPCKGKRRFFTVPPEVEAEIEAMGMMAKKKKSTKSSAKRAK